MFQYSRGTKLTALAARAVITCHVNEAECVKCLADSGPTVRDALLAEPGGRLALSALGHRGVVIGRGWALWARTVGSPQ